MSKINLQCNNFRFTHMFCEIIFPVCCCQCFIFLDDPLAVSDILEKLVKGSEVSN